MIAILHNIRSMYNVASMFRTADAAGVEKIFLTGYSPAPIDRFGKKRLQFVKVSLGAEDSVPWEKVSEIGRLIKKLKTQGVAVCAVEQDSNALQYNKFKPKRDVALVFGNEVRGLRKTLLKKVDHILEIPMWGKKESLNVSVAFGIIIYELQKKHV